MNINLMSKEELFEKFPEWLESQDNGSETETHPYYCPVHVTTSAAHNIVEVAQLHIGDVISFTTSDDDHIEAVAVRRDGDNMLFVTVDCLKDRFCMNSSSGNDSYYGMIAHLNDVYDTFPDNLKDVMVSLPNGDMLRLLTAGEVFGKDIEKYEYSDDEPDQIQYFIKRRNRIAMDATDDTEWWWLSNRVKNSSAYFAGVDHNGGAACDDASNAGGVRPAFLIARESIQPERTCVNCGRTANNGGWYADGRTRCPIEEHYALPKDGYCHLWEKRNVTDDDYPERRTDESDMRDK